MAASDSALNGSPQSAPAPHQKILVVDDEEINLKLLRVSLQTAGYEVFEASGGREALQKVEQNNPDLVMLDILLDDLDGYEVTKRIRQDPRWQALPILMLTAFMNIDVRVKTLDAGADDFLLKPFSRLELLARVKSLLRVKALRDGLEERKDELERMNRRMEQVNRELAARNKELELGMDMAHKLQEAFLPDEYPNVPGLAFYHKFLPADRIGGDFFEIMQLGEERAGIFICDVSGHGVHAALVTSVVKTLFDDITERASNPSEVLAMMNTRFRSILGALARQVFCTAFFMSVDGASRTVDVACAGHPSPLLIEAATGRVTPLVGDDQGGPAIGFFNDSTFDVVTRQLNPGDLMMGFTDGLFEVHDIEEEEYGETRLATFLSNHHTLDPPQLVRGVLEDTRKFLGGRKQADDVCVVTVKFAP